MRKKIGEIKDDVIILAGLALGAYLLLNKLGLGGEDPAILNENNLAPSENPFSYQFQPFSDFYNNNPPLIQVQQAPGSLFNWMFSSLMPGGAPTTTAQSPNISQFFNALKNSPTSSSVWGYLDTVNLSARAEQIYNAINVNAFNPLSTSDQNTALSAFAGLTNQLQIAFIACYLWYNYNQDLLIFLNGSLFKPGLSSSNLATLINRVNALPTLPTA